MPSAFLFFFFFFLDDPFRKRRSTPLHESPVQGGPVIDPSLRTLLCGFFFPFWGFELPELRLRLRGPLRERLHLVESVMGTRGLLLVLFDYLGTTLGKRQQQHQQQQQQRQQQWRTDGRKEEGGRGLRPASSFPDVGLLVSGFIYTAELLVVQQHKKIKQVFFVPRSTTMRRAKKRMFINVQRKKRTRPKLLHRVLERIDLVLYLQVQFIIDTKLNFGLIGFISTS